MFTLSDAVIYIAIFVLGYVVSNYRSLRKNFKSEMHLLAKLSAATEVANGLAARLQTNLTVDGKEYVRLPQTITSNVIIDALVPAELMANDDKTIDATKCLYELEVGAEKFIFTQPELIALGKTVGGTDKSMDVARLTVDAVKNFVARRPLPAL